MTVSGAAIETDFGFLKPAFSAYPANLDELARRLGGIDRYGLKKPISFRQIYDAVGIETAIYALRSVEPFFANILRHMAVDFAAVNMRDVRPFAVEALKIARLNAMGMASDHRLAVAYDQLKTADALGTSAVLAALDESAGDACWRAFRCSTDPIKDEHRKAYHQAYGSLLLLYTDKGERPAGSVGLLRRYIRAEVSETKKLSLLNT